MILYETCPMKEHLVKTVDTDGLVLKNQGNSCHSAECALMGFPLFMGWWGLTITIAILGYVIL